MPHDILLIIVSFISGNGTAFIGNLLGRSKLKADNAKKEADAAKTLADVAVQVASLNIQLNDEVKNLKHVITILTNALDEILPHVTGLTEGQRKRLKDANTIAKLSI